MVAKRRRRGCSTRSKSLQSSRTASTCVLPSKTIMSSGCSESSRIVGSPYCPPNGSTTPHSQSRKTRAISSSSARRTGSPIFHPFALGGLPDVRTIATVRSGENGRAFGVDIEILRPDLPRGGFRSALFDFDGTLSLLREGWPQVMIPMMVDVLRGTGTAESDGALARAVEEFVMRLNGRQTIYQMIQLADEVRRRGGTPLDPLAYKHRYHDLLMERIHGRLGALEAGAAAAEDWTVPGSHALLRALRDRGLALYLASGTDLKYVR